MGPKVVTEGNPITDDLAAVPVQATETVGDRPLTLGGPPIDKIIIAIHRIGSQRRSDTIRSVARRFGDRGEPPLPREER